MMMKTFKDLKFLPHHCGSGVQARMDFPNSYGVSVVQFKIGDAYGSYTNNYDEYEVAVMKNGRLCYNTIITDDVIGYCKKRKVTEIMKRVQELPKPKKGAK